MALITKLIRACRIQCIVLAIHLFLLSGKSVCPQIVLQQLTSDEFTSELRKAVAADNQELSESLIKDNRLLVKPFVNVLITECITKELNGKTAESKQVYSIAEKSADIFETIFGEKSLSIGVKYLTIWSGEHKAKKILADSLYSAGTRYRVGNEPEKAVLDFQEALDIYRNLEDERGEAEVLGGFGAVYFNNMRDNEMARKYYNDALIKREKIDDKALIGNSLNSLGSVYFRDFQEDPAATHSFEQAINFYDKAAALRAEIGDLSGLRTTKSYKAAACKEYGNQLNITGRFDETIEILEKASEIYQEIYSRSEYGETVSQIGFIYSKLGDYNRAAEKLTEAVNIMKVENDSLGLAGVYNHFGIVLQRAGRTERALEYYNNALKIYEEKEDFNELIPVIGNLGTLFFDLKDYSKAEEYHIRGLKLCREVKNQEKELDYLLNLANDLIFLNKFEEAIDYYQSGLKLARELRNPDIIWRITAGMAEYYESRGDYEKAVELNDSALKLLDSLRNTLRNEELKASFMARERFVFEDIISLLEMLHENDKSRGYDKLAFNYAERCKSRVLLDLLAESVTDNTKGADNSTGTGLYNLPRPHLVSIDEVKALCPDKNSLILEYSVGDSSSCLWAITSQEFKIFRLPGRKELQDQIETIRFALQHPEEKATEFFTKAGFTLYEKLIKPAESFLTKRSRLIIIPDGILNYLPFEVLLTETDGKSREIPYADLPFLVKKYPVSYVQSASILRNLLLQRIITNDLRSGSKSIIAFGDPVYEDDPAISTSKGYQRLDYSEWEIKKIASYFKPGYSEIFLSKEATEENVKREGVLLKYNYVHFATHGIIDEEKPDLSSLILSRDINGEEDGYLRASEIFNLKLNSELVVLSACQTGLGKLIRGEGMVGLTRAFMYAGTPSVLVSLWSVADNSTSVLMGEFYKNLIRNKLSKTDALRKAQLALMGDKQFAHPFYWAPFVLIGDWR